MLLRRHRGRHRVDLCRACGSDFVYPVTWADEVAKEFDAKLDRDEFVITRVADRLHEEWRRAEVDAFAAGMEHGVITGDDFGC